MKLLILTIVCLGLGLFFAPYVRIIFALDPERCEKYKTVYQNEEYSIPYGTRVKAVVDGCW